MLALLPLYGESGIVLRMEVLPKRLVPSPDKQAVHLIHRGSTVRESEVLIEGPIRVPRANIQAVTRRRS